jgi:hypothetical protein
MVAVKQLTLARQLTGTGNLAKYFSSIILKPIERYKKKCLKLVKRFHSALTTKTVSYIASLFEQNMLSKITHIYPQIRREIMSIKSISSFNDEISKHHLATLQ